MNGKHLWVNALPTPGVDDYEAFCAAVLRIARIDLHQYKRQQMERRIRAFAQRRGVSDLGEYAQIIVRDHGELSALLDRMTINVSQLFRNPEQWGALADEILPALSRSVDGPIKAWSAGCSYGAEAFSLAALSTKLDVSIRIRATDIDASALARASEGVFSVEDIRSAPDDITDRYFPPDATDRRVALPELKRLITFGREDLLTGKPPVASFDLIMCRNVVIYFTQEARMRVHESLAHALRPGGYLLVGNTERITQPLAGLGLETIRPFIYRRT